MKKIFAFCCNLLPHLVLILSLMFLVLFTLDRINPSMAFLAGSEAKWLLFAFCLFSLLQALLILFGKEK